MDMSTTISAYVLNGVAYCERCIVRAVCAFHDIPASVLAVAGYDEWMPAEYVLAYLFRGNVATLRGPLSPALRPSPESRDDRRVACAHLSRSSR
jgi:hypothetical protein